MNEPIIKAKENCHYATEEGKIMDVIQRLSYILSTTAMFSAENYRNIIQAGSLRSPIPQERSFGSLIENSFIDYGHASLNKPDPV